MKETKMIVSLVFFALLLIILSAVLAIAGTLYSDINQFLLLLCLALGGAAVVAMAFGRPGSWKSAEEDALRSPARGVPNTTMHSVLGVTKRTHPIRVRLRIERWKNERRALIEEPREKALRWANSKTCPKCGSYVPSICVCRYRSKYRN